MGQLLASDDGDVSTDERTQKQSHRDQENHGAGRIVPHAILIEIFAHLKLSHCVSSRPGTMTLWLRRHKAWPSTAISRATNPQSLATRSRLGRTHASKDGHSSEQVVQASLLIPGGVGVQFWDTEGFVLQSKLLDGLESHTWARHVPFDRFEPAHQVTFDDKLLMLIGHPLGRPSLSRTNQ